MLLAQVGIGEHCPVLIFTPAVPWLAIVRNLTVVLPQGLKLSLKVVLEGDPLPKASVEVFVEHGIDVVELEDLSSDFLSCYSSVLLVHFKSKTAKRTT